MTIDDAIARFVRHVQAQENIRASSTPNVQPFTIGTTTGPRFTRITRADAVSRSVVWFVRNDDGSIWYPAGWRGPARNFPRGNVFESDSFPSR